MRRFLWIVILSLSAATLPAAAGAGRLTIEDVRAMAFDKGIATIKEIELDDGVWEVEGRDDSGHKIEMEVDARSGEIVKMRRKDYGASPASRGQFIPTLLRLEHEPFFCRHTGLYRRCRRKPDMAINSLRNKPFGPGGSTRRLHHQGSVVRDQNSPASAV